MIKNILEYLELCVDKYPSKSAVAYKDESISFLELNQKASQYGYAVSKAIDSNGCAKPVGVFCARDIEPIVAFFGVIYSGNFYVPLDPCLPTEKLQSIIDDSGMQVIVGTDADRETLLKVRYDGAFITPDDLSEKMLSFVKKDDDTPLYMVYTSGSTGKPKGVLKSHKAEISFIEAYCETFDFSENDVIGNQTPFYFDAAGKDIYLMLKMGITMEIIPTEYFPLPTELITYLNKKKITFASWVPTVLSIVAQLNPFSLVKPETLKKVFFVGEVMPMKHLNTWMNDLPDIKYVNLYGQSELCGICCYYEVKERFPNDVSLPMGVPLKNCDIYLLDGDKLIENPRQIGEMYIVSDALAIEYYNDEEKTQKSFIYKDFGKGPVRCFKTGDLAEYDQNGNLVFASRTDFQIKHMGHRIELGEIETISGALSEISRCCCLYNSEKKKIILFCELAPDCTMTGVELKSKLKTKLSSYMVPAKVVVMDKLPLNANGKIDRQKLKSML